MSSVVQNKTYLVLTDSYLVDGVVQAYLGGTAALEIVDPNGTRLADVAASWTTSGNVAATATFQVTVVTEAVTFDENDVAIYSRIKPPYLFQFKVTQSGGHPQYMNQFGVNVVANIDD